MILEKVCIFLLVSLIFTVIARSLCHESLGDTDMVKQWMFCFVWALLINNLLEWIGG